MIKMLQDFDSAEPIEKYIDINSPLPENFLDIVDKRISYLKEHKPKNLNQELGYLAATGSIGWWWWHDKRDHEEGIDEKTKEAYSKQIKEFAALEAYITTSATKDGAKKAGEYLLHATKLHDDIEEAEDAEKITDISALWKKNVIPNLKGYFSSCGLDENIGEHRSDFWLAHHDGNYDRASEAYANEIREILKAETEQYRQYNCTIDRCKKNIADTVKLHDSKEKGWQNDAHIKFNEFWTELFNLRNSYTLPYDRTGNYNLKKPV
ncbi:MAG: hypothetical protein KAJ88_00115 [Candidatus Aenigmarchaeota archaeon]|nr:hypothetical protein [Candidatus Aenigmarchaeota archaeon]